MVTAHRRIHRCALVIISLLVAAPAAAQGFPERITDADFWQMISDMSEPNGYFQSENFLSNEIGFQGVIPELQQTVHPGGAYLGVGPEQNFTYIVAVHPAVAFIIDIRHQNAVQHLLYKALMEVNDNRVDFLCQLFSRPRPAGLANDAPIDAIFTAIDAAPRDSMMYYRTLDAMKNHLEKDHRFTLSSDEISLLEHNFDVFYEAGPELSYTFGRNNGFGGFGGRSMPTYSQLMVATDNAETQRSYLASDANYRALRDMELRNLIVPLTGDFAGPRAIRAAGEWVRSHGGTVTAFYTSNVEQYLFQNGVWAAFANNVATLPLDSTSTFIRSGGGGARGYGGGMRSSLLQSMTLLLAAFNAGKITTYQDVLGTSH